MNINDGRSENRGATQYRTVEGGRRRCSLSRHRHLAWAMFLIHCHFTTTSASPYITVSAKVAAIIFPRTDAKRNRSVLNHYNLKHPQRQQRYKSSHIPYQGGGSTRDLTTFSLSMAKRSSSSSNKLRLDRQNATSRHHQGATTAFVSSLKNPLSSIWRRLRKTTIDSELSAFQDHEEAVAAVAQTDDELSRIEAAHGQRACQTAVHVAQGTRLANESQQAEASGESVHLQLTQQYQTSEPENNVEGGAEIGKSRNAIIQELSFTSSSQKTTYKALNTCRRKFEAFLNYHGANKTVIESSQILSRKVDIGDKDHADKRKEWRELWKDRRLLTDRTEFLAVYQSDRQDQSPQRNISDKHNQKQQKANASVKRRGGFADLLYLYTDRLLGILQDEDEDHKGKNVKEWLEEAYGKENTNKLVASQFHRLSEPDQLSELQKFADWFRKVMPYYYDKCGSCSASFKDETAAAAAAAVEQSSTEMEPNDVDNCYDDDINEDSNDGQVDDDEDDDKGTFLGYIYPDDHELNGKASRTELYQCHKCQEYTRFPRYNSAHAIIDSKRGRCGEYSTLLYRFLRALDLEARWVVDWADHVWAEVLLEGDHGKRRWVHLDPCEAAVDNPLLYQGWGKKQTFVIALYAPPKAMMEDMKAKELTKLTAPLVQDVTDSYTSDSLAMIGKRREESEEEIHTAISKAISELSKKLELAQTC